MNTYVYQDISQVSLHTEQDIVLAYKRARQLSAWCGMATAAQTKFATAVSEICRNVLEHVGAGGLAFHLLDMEGRLHLEALANDEGQGIAHVDEWLARQATSSAGKGHGLVNARKLVDNFRIDTHAGRGTRVHLRQALPYHHPPVDPAVVQGWQQRLTADRKVSPYEELKRQNTEILDMLETLQRMGIDVQGLFSFLGPVAAAKMAEEAQLQQA